MRRERVERGTTPSCNGGVTGLEGDPDGAGRRLAALAARSLASCGGGGGAKAGGEPTEATGRWGQVHTGICAAAAAAAKGDRKTAEQEYDDVHAALHELAAAVEREDRAAAARLLEAKQRVEATGTRRGPRGPVRHRRRGHPHHRRHRPSPLSLTRADPRRATARDRRDCTDAVAPPPRSAAVPTLVVLRRPDRPAPRRLRRWRRRRRRRRRRRHHHHDRRRRQQQGRPVRRPGRQLRARRRQAQPLPRRPRRQRQRHDRQLRQGRPRLLLPRHQAAAGRPARAEAAGRRGHLHPGRRPAARPQHAGSEGGQAVGGHRRVPGDRRHLRQGRLLGRAGQGQRRRQGRQRQRQLRGRRRAAAAVPRPARAPHRQPDRGRAPASTPRPSTAGPRAAPPSPTRRCTRTSIDAALDAKKPTVVVVSTPVYCVSQFCGPITDSVAKLADTYKDKVAFVHLEVWKDFEKQQVNPSAQEWITPKDGGDTKEPWVFLVGADGNVTQRFDNVVSDAELEASVKALAGCPRSVCAHGARRYRDRSSTSGAVARSSRRRAGPRSTWSPRIQLMQYERPARKPSASASTTSRARGSAIR